MSGLLFIGLVIAVLVLLSKLSECRYQLSQVTRERDVYERIYNDWVAPDFGQPSRRTRPNFVPDWTER